jgi:nucleoside-diphosphate-sugar epimerase
MPGPPDILSPTRLDKNAQEIPGWLVRGRAPKSVTAIAMDIRDVTAEHLGGFAAVVHLAALSNDRLGDLQPETTLRINHLGRGTRSARAKDAGVPWFLFSSSLQSYGAHDEAPLDELAESTRLRRTLHLRSWQSAIVRLPTTNSARLSSGVRPLRCLTAHARRRGSRSAS